MALNDINLLTVPHSVMKLIIPTRFYRNPYVISIRQIDCVLQQLNYPPIPRSLANRLQVLLSNSFYNVHEAAFFFAHIVACTNGFQLLQEDENEYKRRFRTDEQPSYHGRGLFMIRFPEIYFLVNKEMGIGNAFITNPDLLIASWYNMVTSAYYVWCRFIKMETGEYYFNGSIYAYWNLVNMEKEKRSGDMKRRWKVYYVVNEIFNVRVVAET